MGSPTLDEYPLRPIQKVAVVGAGISGISAAAHLLRSGLSVTVFERSSGLGGVWNYDPRVPNDPPFPNERPSVGDYTTSAPGSYAAKSASVSTGLQRCNGPSVAKATALADGIFDAIEVEHAPPSACYYGLKNNIPTSLMNTSLGSYPAGTEEVVGRSVIHEYIKNVFRSTDVDKATLFNTRVEGVSKHIGDGAWIIRTLSLQKSGESVRHVEQHWEFDAVVVASGHFNAPKLPNFPGLDLWKARYPPDRVIHSKQYRSPERFSGKNVLLIGGAVSSNDIARELGGIANKIYQSTRDGRFDLSSALLPPGAERVAAVKSFSLTDQPNGTSCYLANEADPDAVILGHVNLSDGRVLENIHHVILGTGYLTSYPFLAHLHADTTPAEAAGDQVLVTADGNITHNLYKEVFYIPDPTLAFIGVPVHLSLFPTADVQSQLVARVFSGQARLPIEGAMRREYGERVRRKGLGKYFHSYLGEGEELRYVEELVELANAGAAQPNGAGGVKGHSDAWIAGYWDMREKAKWVFSDGRAWDPVAAETQLAGPSASVRRDV
jgi:cation diffusion facilitator CzcD-associated flavoprotein CzcO